MTDTSTRELLPEKQYIRDKLMGGEKSSIRRYADLVVGEGASYDQLLKYELITGLFGGLPGALGLALRQLFYPSLFERTGKGVVFGRHVVIRNAGNIRLGDRVIIDDCCVIDGRGAGPAGVVIGDRVIVNRGTTIQAKIGPIQIGDDCDIGTGSRLPSQGGVYIGRAVVIGGGCKISGGAFQIERSAPDNEAPAGAPREGMVAREQARWTDSNPRQMPDRDGRDHPRWRGRRRGLGDRRRHGDGQERSSLRGGRRGSGPGATDARSRCRGLTRRPQETPQRFVR
jgi:acetyltransferase-like isoleucine patch superfamily enzyme